MPAFRGLNWMLLRPLEAFKGLESAKNACFEFHLQTLFENNQGKYETRQNIVVHNEGKYETRQNILVLRPKQLSKKQESKKNIHIPLKTDPFLCSKVVKMKGKKSDKQFGAHCM